MRSLPTSALAAAVTWFGAPASAFAHGFAERYDLPLPFWLYLGGAGAAVALSFLAVGLFAREPGPQGRGPRFDLLRFAPFRALAHPIVRRLLRLVSVGLFALLLIAGFFGTRAAYQNLVPTFVWVIWWVGLAYVCALLGNLWALVNPWAALFGWAEALFRRLSRAGRPRRVFAYPDGLGVWPAVALFLAFAWIELAWEHSARPDQLALLIVLYSMITWAGMLAFGKEVWLRGGEAFSVAFGLLARFAPTEVRVTAPAACAACPTRACRERPGDCVDCAPCFARADPGQRAWNLRPFAAGFLAARPVSGSMMVFVLLMLASVAFDGLKETPLWGSLLAALFTAPGIAPLVPLLRAPSGDAADVVITLALVLLPVVFLGVYLAVVRLMRAAAEPSAGAPGRHGEGTWALARRFVLCLVPIALAYHLAHYLSFLLVSGQRIVALASDPLGLGWDLFGTAGFTPDIGLVDARFAWYSAVVAIVLGHMVSVFLAHRTALTAFGAARPALRSQVPMLALMIGYTTLSLWILAQPVVELG